jgi:HEAT repeat protein
MENRNDVIEALIDALDDASEAVRRSATEALGKIGLEALPKLIAAITYDGGYNIHRFIGAARALAEIGPDGREAIPALIRGLRFVPAQQEFLEAGAQIREVAARALGEICSDTTTTRSKAS